MDSGRNEKLPALRGFPAWGKLAIFLAVLIAVNVVAFAVTFGFGIIATLPLTLWLGFLVLRDLLPLWRLPPGRRRDPDPG